MTNRAFLLSRRRALAVLGAAAAAPQLALAKTKAHAEPKHEHHLAEIKPQTPEALIAAAKLGGEVGYIVVEAESGRVLESSAADRPMPPASVAKTLTATYALEVLGQDYRFVTKVIGTGPVSNGIVQGDLVLWSSFDAPDVRITEGCEKKFSGGPTFDALNQVLEALKAVMKK